MNKNKQTLSASNRYLLRGMFFTEFMMGVYLLLVGSVLPQLKAEYEIGYRIGGAMMSVQSVGYLAAGACAGFLPRLIGIKSSLLTISNLAFVGLFCMMVTGNPVLLLLSMLMTGVSKGVTGTFTNQVVSTLSQNDAAQLNLLQAYFAIGACAAPLIAMFCGASWRMAFAITIGMGIVNAVYNLRLHIGPEAYAMPQSFRPDFGFFRSKVFWLCSIVLGCYLGVESSVMGWLVTYFVDTGVSNEATAQLISTGLWFALLVGRFGSAKLAQRFRPCYMLAVMTGGMLLFFTLMVVSRSLIPMAIGAVGLGLFMAGMYGTAIGDTDDLMDRYPLCMGMLIAVPGLVSALVPGVVGVLSDYIGIRGGMTFLYALIAVLIVTVAVDIRFRTAKSQ